METTHQIAPTLLTERERLAIDRINAVLDGDGNDPEAGPGAWADCGEVDVPVLLDAVRRLEKQALGVAAPLADAALAELAETSPYSALPWATEFHQGGGGSIRSASPNHTDNIGTGPFPTADLLMGASYFAHEEDVAYIVRVINALPGLLARVQQAEAKVAPAGILSNGDLMTRLIKLATAYRPSAQDSIARNCHMHDLPLGPEFAPDQSQIDAVLTNFLNHVGVAHGMDLGLYSSDLASKEGGASA